MIRRLRKLKATLAARLPQSRLEPLTAKHLAHLIREFPKLPAHLRNFFKEIGCGCIGNSRYMIYDLLSPKDFFDDETATGLDGVFLIGDDFAGHHEAYDTRGRQWIFGMVGSNGKFVPHTEYTDFVDFIEKWYTEE
jgi:hypothetical protein